MNLADGGSRMQEASVTQNGDSKSAKHENPKMLCKVYRVWRAWPLPHHYKRKLGFMADLENVCKGMRVLADEGTSGLAPASLTENWGKFALLPSSGADVP